MKKLVIMMGAIVVAACVQAATLNWAITAVPASSATTTDLTTYTALLYFTDGAGTVGGSFGTVSQSDVVASLTGTSVDSGYVLSKALNAAGAATGATNLSSSFGAGDSVTGFAVILDGSVDNYSHYIVTGSATASWTSATGAKMMSFGSQASATWTAVPEPTSGMLMLLGMAGLALRRRRA